MQRHGRRRVSARHGVQPYWEVNGVTFVDRDGYRTVLQNRAWGVVGDESHVAAS
jgi:hypothetical protein